MIRAYGTVKPYKGRCEKVRRPTCAHPHLKGVGMADEKGRKVQFCPDCQNVVPRVEKK